MAKNDRFVKVYEQVSLGKSKEIWVDKVTGVNYLYFWQEFSGGSLTPLLDKDGKPIITPIDNK